MPVYVYRNLKTDETFEIEQRITEDALKTHPETGDPVRRLIQPVGISFKGSGFYVNDSRSSKSTSKPAATDSGDKADSKADKKSDVKSDAKSESKGSDSAKAAETKKDTKVSSKSDK